MKITIPMLAITPHGGNRVLIELANYLVNQHHQVIVLSTTKNNSPFVIDSRVEVKIIFNSVGNKYIRFLFFLLFSPFFMRDGIIIANHFLTVYPAKLTQLLFRTRCVFFVQGIESECFEEYPKLLSGLLKTVNSVAFRLCDVIPANSFLSSKLIMQGVKISHEFNLGVSRKWIVKSNHKPKYDVVYFAREEYNKGLDRFLDVVRINRNISFLCISQNQDLLNELSSEPNISIKCPSSDQELYQHLDICKLLLLTSYFEGFALPPLEAMGRGLPLVYFDCGGPSVYADNNNSILISETCEFTRSYERINKNYQEYSLSAFQTAKKFELECSFSNLCSYLLTFD